MADSTSPMLEFTRTPSISAMLEFTRTPSTRSLAQAMKAMKAMEAMEINTACCRPRPHAHMPTRPHETFKIRRSRSDIPCTQPNCLRKLEVVEVNLFLCCHTTKQTTVGVVRLDQRLATRDKNTHCEQKKHYNV